MLRQIAQCAALALAALAVTAVFAACSSGTSAGAASKASTPAASGASGASTGTTSLKIVMKDNAFDPSAVTVPVNQKITIDYENQGATVHNLMMSSKDLAGQDVQSPVT